MDLIEATAALVADLDGLEVGPPTAYVYNPLVYARQAWALYCERHGRGQRKVLFLGMNPGPPGLSKANEAGAGP